MQYVHRHVKNYFTHYLHIKHSNPCLVPSVIHKTTRFEKSNFMAQETWPTINNIVNSINLKKRTWHTYSVENVHLKVQNRRNNCLF